MISPIDEKDEHGNYLFNGGRDESILDFMTAPEREAYFRRQNAKPTIFEMRDAQAERERQWAAAATAKRRERFREHEAHMRELEARMERIALEHRRCVVDDVMHLCGYPQPGFCHACLKYEQ